jgi:outer membrane lipoprotein LolB
VRFTHTKGWIRGAVWVLLGIILSGCSTFSPTANSGAYAPATLSWTQREHQLQQITAWHVQGVIGIQQSQKSDSSSIDWHQQDSQHFALRLFGPFGAGATEIHGGPGGVQLISSSHPTPVTAIDAETLVAQQTGWNVPVGHLYYWVRGLPIPAIANRSQMDNTHRLAVLEQDGWTVTYLGYSTINGIELPDKIQLTHAGLRVKLVIKHWQL